MKRIHQFAAILFLLLWVSTPLVVCAQHTSSQMPVAEHACCQQLKLSCGQMQMPASHACCDQDVQSTQTVAVYKDKAVVPPPAMAVWALPGVPSLLPGHFVPVAVLSDSPPRFSSSASSILRI